MQFKGNTALAIAEKLFIGVAEYLGQCPSMVSRSIYLKINFEKYEVNFVFRPREFHILSINPYFGIVSSVGNRTFQYLKWFISQTMRRTMLFRFAMSSRFK